MPKTKAGRPHIGRKVAITLPEELIEELRQAGEARGLGYQTMARVILTERISDYLTLLPKQKTDSDTARR